MQLVRIATERQRWYVFEMEFNDNPEGAVIDVRQSRQNLGGANKGYISKTNTKYVRQTRIESLVASRLALQNSC